MVRCSVTKISNRLHNQHQATPFESIYIYSVPNTFFYLHKMQIYTRYRARVTMNVKCVNIKYSVAVAFCFGLFAKRLHTSEERNTLIFQ